MTTGEGMTYADTGVDVDIEALAAKILYEGSKATWGNREGLLGEVIVPYDNFAGLRYIRGANLPEGTVWYGNVDGLGTKTAIVERSEQFVTAAQDLMAMVCDDAVIRGAEPVVVKNHLKVNTLGKDTSRLPFVQEVADGFSACSLAGVAMINGEISQENDRMGELDKFKIELTGDVTWFGNESRLITGFDVQEGQYLVGLREEGLRCNGISLVSKLLEREYQDKWHDYCLGDERLIDLAVRPSRVYSKAIVDMFGGWNLDRLTRAELSAVAHISGGGLPEKFDRVLSPSGLGVFMDDLFEPSPLMLHCQQLGIVEDREAYKTWNMGQGMVCVTSEPENVLTVASDHEIEAKVIGRVEKRPGVRIKSLGHYSAGQILEYEPKAA